MTYFWTLNTMLLSQRLLVARILSVVIFLLVGVCDATAARRSVRVDFLAWTDGTPIESCSGYDYSYSRVKLENATFYTSRTLGFNEQWKPYSYCQDSKPWSEGLARNEYLNHDVFDEEESVLADEIGSNDSEIESQNVTARKYSFFDEFGRGYQWTFYDFPGGLTLVGYYDSAIDQSPKVRKGDEIVWQGEYNGEYFCFENRVFTGVSDGSKVCEDVSLSEIERDALVALYNSTDGGNWDYNLNWLEGDPCFNSWHGVTCEKKWDDETGKEVTTVTDLSLSYNNLNGSIPPELGNLTRLNYLDLSDNDLSGSIPGELGNLTDLYSLWLQRNSLSGNIPEELGNLGGLYEIYLDSNKLTGLIPDSLENLQYVNLVGLRWNGLQTNNASLDSILDDLEFDGDWSITQTIPPANLVITGVGPTSISLAWDAIEYTDDTGRYRVWYSMSPEGPFLDGGATDDKLDTAHTVTGLEEGVSYYLVVRSETDNHYENQNDVVSEDSALLYSDEILSDGFE